MGAAGTIAAVTSTLRGRLQRGLAVAEVEALIGPAAVTTLRPAEFRGHPSGPSQLNLALHHLVPAAERVDGRLTLELHYLITAFGTDARADELLLGAALVELDEHPVLTVGGARLAATLLPLGLAQWARVWRAIGGPQRPSVLARVAPVLL